MTGPKGSIALAIDTATAVTGVALFDGGVLGELTWHSGHNQTVELLPAVLWLMKQQDCALEDVGAIVVSLGPGTFNGLRVGISTAKSLAFARGIPALGIGTLEAIAFQHSEAERLVRPLYDAGRGEVATALYRLLDGQLRQLEEPHLTTISALTTEIDQPTLICGEVNPTWKDIFRQGLGSLVLFPSPAAMLRRPGFLAELGWRRWSAGERDDVVALQPIYLRRPAITLPKQ